MTSQVGTRLVDEGEVKAETTGMFVVVTATLAVPGSQKVYMNQAQLITDDRTYDPGRAAVLSADPGFAGASSWSSRWTPRRSTTSPWRSGPPARPRVLRTGRIHLGITAENAEQWRQAAGGRELPTRSGTTVALP